MLQDTNTGILLNIVVLTQLFGHVDSAWTKTITSSSVHPGPYGPQKAIDGNPGRDPEMCRCCAVTYSELNPWYQLDLGVNRTVHRIHVEGRTDNPNYGQYFQGMRIYLKSVHNDIKVGEEIRINEVTFNVDYILPEPKPARYVSLVLYDITRVFTICELTVYGECTEGTFGGYCEDICHCEGDPCNTPTGECPSGTCLPGYNGTACDKECPDGKYGAGCTESCGNCSSTDVCKKQDGRCPGQCADGYQGDTCKQECDGGFYGQSCENECGKCHDGEPCNAVTGQCDNGCAAGYETDVLCKTECTPGTYGVGCTETCGNCTGGTNVCAETDGVCPEGCVAGYKGEICKTECDDGTYGENCNADCGNCLNGAACNTMTGFCGDGCSAEYTGDLCVDKCRRGLYGNGCSKTCGNCVTDTTCHHIDGNCTGGCIAGFKAPLCDEKCDNGTFGPGCFKECGRCLNNATCDIANGTCTECEIGYVKPYCTPESSASNPSEGAPAAAIGGAVGGVAVISAVVIVIVIFVRRRRDTAFRNVLTKSPPDKPSLSRSKIEEPKSKSKPRTEPTKQRNNDDDMYVGVLTRATDLKTCQLWDYIWQKKKDDNLLFYQEFNRLTSGMQHPHEVALMKGNRPLTRYRALCAYDHSRVPLDTADGGNGYINASFINGVDKSRKFIASQDPTVAMRNDFWRMIWQYNSSKIVMLANLIEIRTERCLIYWPEEESTDVTYGNITVSFVSKHVTTDYDIRHLKVKQNSSTARDVTQYHFRSWPDKDVPDSTWPLVKFWRTVMEDSIDGSGPIVVHCSAGIGRTGTFIAMDNAYHQAKGIGNITMLDLVKTLRDQRVNMVQTKDQYVFLHEAVADALLFGTHVIWSRDFENIYNFFTQMEHGRSIPRMQEQFNLIVESVEDRKKLQQKKDGPATAKLYSNIFISNNPKETVVSIDEFMPKSKSMVHVREHGAVLLPNYEGKDAFIVCRSPTEASFAGFWSIIAEQNIKTVIMMTETTSKNYKKCKELGSTESSVKSKFGVKVLKESMTNKYCQKRFTFDNNNSAMTVTQFEFKNWSIGNKVPVDSRSMLNFLNVVLRSQQRLKTAQPILVHCSTGFERSGLVCVLINELERMKREQGHINILQTVKLMKERNEHIIPNYEQYKYVYDTIMETFKKDTASEEEIS